MCNGCSVSVSPGFNPKLTRINFSYNKLKHDILWQQHSFPQSKLKFKWNMFSLLVFAVSMKKLTELFQIK